MSSKLDLNEISKDMISFIDSFKSVIISSDFGEYCTASYAPFVRHEEKIYILISQIAKHYNAIKNAPNKVQIMFLQDENDAQTIFARRRVSFVVKADFIDKKDEILEKFKNKFKHEAPLEMILKMSDFHFVCLDLKKGRLVNGFGAAYDTDGLSVIKRVGENMPHKFEK